MLWVVVWASAAKKVQFKSIKVTKAWEAPKNRVNAQCLTIAWCLCWANLVSEERHLYFPAVKVGHVSYRMGNLDIE